MHLGRQRLMVAHLLSDIGARIYPREYFIVLCGSLTPEAYADETESNRQLIRGLIQKWMRPVLGLGSR